MNYKSFVFIFGFGIFGLCAAECDDSDKKVIFDCYNTHLNQYNYTAPIYEYVFTVLRFNTLQGKNNCTAFEALGKCIGENRFDTCVTTESLSKILGKSWEDARDLLYIYRRMQIFCSYLPELLRDRNPRETDCYDDNHYSTTCMCSCAIHKFSHKKSNSSAICEAYPSYIDCSVRYIGYGCQESFARMHCDFLNLIVPTYHSYCGLKPINCTKFNFAEDSKKGIVENAEIIAAALYFGRIYSTQLSSANIYLRYIYASIFIVILFSALKKKSPLKTSFFALFLLIPFYDTVFVISYILQTLPFLRVLISYMLSYLDDIYATLMSLVLLFMSINRFTAINFPLKHQRLWSRGVTTSIITISLFFTILFTIISKIVQEAADRNVVKCQNISSLFCYLQSTFDIYGFARQFKWFRCLFSFSLCGLCVSLLIATAIRYEFFVKNKSEVLKSAEKRLFLITFTEVILITVYIVFHNFTHFVYDFKYQYISLHERPAVFVHHFVSIALFFVFSRAIRNAYIQFFFLDVLFGKVIKIYPFSIMKKRNERIVSIPSIHK